MEQEHKRDVGAVVNRFMDPCAMHLDAWASLRIMRAGGASAVEWADVFPNVPEPDPVPFPANHRGETIVRQDEIEEGSDRKYGKLRKDSPSIESMANVVELCIEAFQGPEYLRGLLLYVHPETGRCRPSDYPADPFHACAERDLGPNVASRTKFHVGKSYASLYGQFKAFLRKELAHRRESAEAFATSGKIATSEQVTA